MSSTQFFWDFSNLFNFAFKKPLTVMQYIRLVDRRKEKVAFVAFNSNHGHDFIVDQWIMGMDRGKSI